MIKPRDYDNVTEYGNVPPLAPGGYVCRIMQVEETTAKSSGAPMLKINLDIAEGENKDYFANKYRADSRTEKKWGCVVNQLVYNSDGTTSRGFKSFNTSVEKSNQGFVIPWGDNYAKAFKGKLVGGVFRREQFVGNDGSLAFSTKCAWFQPVEDIRKGIPVPKDKLLDGGTAPAPSSPQNITAGGYDFEIIADGDLPF